MKTRVVGVDAGDKLLLVAHGLLEARGLALAEDHREQVQRVVALLRERRPWPGQAHARALDIRPARDRSWFADLRLLRKAHVRQIPGRHVRPALTHFRDHLLGVNVAGDDEDHVVGHVHAVIKVGQLVPRDLLERVEIPDRGVPRRVGLVARLLRELPEDAARIALAHGELFENHLAFALELVLGNFAVLHPVREQVDRGGRMFRRGVDVIAHGVEARGGVGLRADAAEDGVALGFGARGGRAAGEQVFEVVREAGPDVLLLVDRAGLHPHLRGDDRRDGYALGDDDHAVVQFGDDAVGSLLQDRWLLVVLKRWLGWLGRGRGDEGRPEDEKHARQRKLAKNGSVALKRHEQFPVCCVAVGKWCIVATRSFGSARGGEVGAACPSWPRWDSSIHGDPGRRSLGSLCPGLRGCLLAGAGRRAGDAQAGALVMARRIRR